MRDNEIRNRWDFAKMIAFNIGSVTLPNEDIVAIDDLLNRQKAEIEEQDQAIINALTRMGEIRTEAITEFAERLKYTLIINNEENTEIFDYDYTLETIDQIAKEMKVG